MEYPVLERAVMRKSAKKNQWQIANKIYNNVKDIVSFKVEADVQVLPRWCIWQCIMFYHFKNSTINWHLKVLFAFILMNASIIACLPLFTNVLANPDFIAGAICYMILGTGVMFALTACILEVWIDNMENRLEIEKLKSI